MQIINKIEATLSPRTDQVAYLNHKPIDLKYSTLNFKDGSLRVKLENPEVVAKGQTLYVAAYMQNMDDVMVVAQLQDIVRRLAQGVVTTVLTISAPLYSRYDRVMLHDGSDAFGAKVFATAINSLGFNIVRYLDCHSDVLVNETKHAYDIKQASLLEYLASTNPHLRDMPTIAPDKGAVKKNTTPHVVFDKVRDRLWVTPK